MHKLATTELEFVEDLPTVAKRKYDTAKAGNALIFSETRLAIIHTGRIPVWNQMCRLVDCFSISNSSN